MKLFDGIVKPNALVRIEVLTTTRGPSGGQIESYSTIADNINCLVSGISPSRTNRHDSTDNMISGTLSGNDPAIGRGDVRYYFYTGPAAGRYACVTAAGTHGPAGELSLIETFYTAKWEQIKPVG